MKCLIYCTKSKPYLYRVEPVNGKVVAECDYEVEEIEPFMYDKDYEGWEYGFDKNGYKTYNIDFDDLLMKSELTARELDNYLQGKNGYAIHIKNLHVFDKPKELSEVYSIHDVGGMLLTDKLKKAPQNMQRISLQEWEYGTYNSKDMAILISIRPEWLCKILNNEKTIEVRKKILNCMKLYDCI